MIKRILMSSNRFNIAFSKDTTEEEKVTRESCICSSLPFLLLKKHIRIVPKVMLQRNTMKSKVVPLVLPPCNHITKPISTFQINSCVFCTYMSIQNLDITQKLQFLFFGITMHANHFRTSNQLLSLYS